MLRRTQWWQEDSNCVTRNDNDVSLSIKDRRFVEIMESGIRKNELGNWEMPLLFRSRSVSMPDNRSYAVIAWTGYCGS